MNNESKQTDPQHTKEMLRRSILARVTGWQYEALIDDKGRMAIRANEVHSAMQEYADEITEQSAPLIAEINRLKDQVEVDNNHIAYQDQLIYDQMNEINRLKAENSELRNKLESDIEALRRHELTIAELKNELDSE